MPTLLAIAFVAGLAAVLTPCVLPVLPLVLGAAARGGGRRHRLALIAGIVGTFVVATLAAGRLVAALGLPAGALRAAGIVAIAVAGAGLVVPRLGDLLGRPFAALGRRGARGASRLASGDGAHGVARSVALGAAIGLVWAPCGGPVLAAISIAAADGAVGRELVGAALAFGAGSAVPLLAIVAGGQRLARRSGPRLRLAAGLLLVGAAAVLTTRLPEQVAAAVPTVSGPLEQLERSAVADAALAGVRGDGQPAAQASTTGGALPDLGSAAELVGLERWLGSPPQSLAQLRGQVVIVDFWAAACSNCIRAIPHLAGWAERYRGAGLQVIGVHTPEFAFERDPAVVRGAMDDLGIGYPVALDQERATWHAYGNHWWPALYLIDRAGHLRARHIGEGSYAEIEAEIVALLAEGAAS